MLEIGRPSPTEAPAHLLGYIHQVPGDDILATLTAQLPETLALFSRYTEQTSLLPYAPGKWSTRQTLGHITDTERIMTFRALWIARGLDAPLPGFDQDLTAANAASDAVPFAAISKSSPASAKPPCRSFKTFPPQPYRAPAPSAVIPSPSAPWPSSPPVTSPTISASCASFNRARALIVREL